jgi:hypothetical protein
MLYLPYYGVPENYIDSVNSFFESPEISALYKEITEQKDQTPLELLEKYHENPYFNYAIGNAAVENNLSFLIPLIYALPDEKREYVHFEWKIPHPEIELTFSNAFFIAYFNELYRDTPDPVGRKLAARGVALRALSHLSYTPWVNFMLPINQDCVENFLKLPLYDRDSEFLAAQGE